MSRLFPGLANEFAFECFARLQMCRRTSVRRQMLAALVPWAGLLQLLYRPSDCVDPRLVMATEPFPLDPAAPLARNANSQTHTHVTRANNVRNEKQ